ncbi:phospholipase A2 family protein [Macrococcus equi]|uniref:phospholipase A2 family protein n=1 Tax=Macrococcus equi TaxID=3395462 RepID=UPI0039BE95FE
MKNEIISKLTLLTSILFLLSVFSYNYVQAEVNKIPVTEAIIQSINGNDVDSIIDGGKKLNNFADKYINENNIIDINKVKEDRLHEQDILFLKEYINEKKKFNFSNTSNQIVTRSVNIPIYGNYCGKGNKGGKPIDDLDAICKRHDQCYEKKGMWNCSCDALIVGELVLYSKNKKYSIVKRTRAKVFMSFFTTRLLSQCKK